MDETLLHPDFKEFLSLLNERQVEYLLVGGYAVTYHGYPRSTADMDIWVRPDPENASRLLSVLHEFGFAVADQEALARPGQMLTMGMPPVRIEIMTSVSGVGFDDCYKDHLEAVFDGVRVAIIDLQNLKRNKLATGRYKDLADLENLPGSGEQHDDHP